VEPRRISNLTRGASFCVFKLASAEMPRLFCGTKISRFEIVIMFVERSFALSTD
jgi:hypothetical protein